MTGMEKVMMQAREVGETLGGSSPNGGHSRARWASIALVVLTLVATAAFLIVRKDKLPADAVLRFDGDVITKTDYEKRVNALSALYGVKPPTTGPAEEDFRRDAAKSIAVSLILDVAAKQNDIVISDMEATTALDKIIDEQLPGGRSDFTKFLGTTGISESDVLDEVKRQLATSRLFESITGDADPATDAEIEEYYDEHQSDMATAERRRIANIVVATEREANQILSAARRGEPFVDLARRYSLDSSTKDVGGDLGWVTQDQLAADFGAAAFAARRGVAFGPVQTEFGWNVGVVIKSQESKPLALEQVTEQLKTELLNQRRLSIWRDWLAERIKSADIEYSDAYRPKDPDAAPTDLPTTTP